jgi:uncharacterized protein (DUF1919 family)
MSIDFSLAELANGLSMISMQFEMISHVNSVDARVRTQITSKFSSPFAELYVACSIFQNFSTLWTFLIILKEFFGDEF